VKGSFVVVDMDRTPAISGRNINYRLSNTQQNSGNRADVILGAARRLAIKRQASDQHFAIPQDRNGMDDGLGDNNLQITGSRLPKPKSSYLR